MSKEVVSQKMKQTCEGCGAFKEWELVGADGNPTILQEMQEWYNVNRKVVTPDGRLAQLTGDACSLSCVPVVAVKLALPPAQQEQTDQIDLSSLRTANLAN
jgi:hypothetical protein